MNTDFIDRVKAKLGRPAENASVSYYMDSLYYFQRLKHNQMQDNGLNFLLGDSIAQLISRNNPMPIEYVAVNDSFGESGTPSQLMEKYGLNAASIVKAAENAIARKA